MLIVASMVERETVAPEERKLVSAVIWNRLAKGMPLGIDATLRYGLGIQGTRPITAAELRNQTPYNTDDPQGPPADPDRQPRPRRRCRPRRTRRRSTTSTTCASPTTTHHFFTASEAEFCAKAKEYGYHPC